LLGNFCELRYGEVQHRPVPDSPGSPARKQEEGAARYRRMEEREDCPNAVTLITLRLPRELRICQVTIISYTT